MTRLFNFFAQLLGFGAQVVIPTFVTNPTSVGKFAAGIAIAQGVVAVIAHSYNPDGTKATLPYQPDQPAETKP